MSMSRSQLRILAAGECATVLAVLARASRKGPSVQVKRFDSAEEAVSILRDWTADLILVDADCSRFSTPALCRALKASPIARLWSILVTSCSARVCSECVAAGADDFLTPGIPPAVLVNRVLGLAQLGIALRKGAVPAVETQEPRPLANTHFSPRKSDRIFSSEAPISTTTCAQAVVLLADLRGYSRIAEQLNPQALVPLLNEYFALLTDISYQHEGTVFHMAGDCLLVGFGVPKAQADMVERAVCTAQEMLVRFGELARIWRDRSNLASGLGIGMHEGAVAAAVVGSPLFMNYTVVGDAVNVAARLCQRARAGEIVLSGTFRNSLRARSIVLPLLQLAPLTFHGRSEPVDLFCVPLEKRMDVFDYLAPAACVPQKGIRREEAVVQLVLPAHRESRIGKHRS